MQRHDVMEPASAQSELRGVTHEFRIKMPILIDRLRGAIFQEKY